MSMGGIRENGPIWQDVQISELVTTQGRLAALLAEQLSWRGLTIHEGTLLDALGMAGLVLNEHGQEDELNPATVAAMLQAVKMPAAVPHDARVFDLDAYRAASSN